MRTCRCPLIFVFASGLAACGGGTTGPGPNPNVLLPPAEACASIAPTVLAVGQHLIVDPSASSGCLKLPAAGAAGAEYLMVLASGSGQRTTTGVQGGYFLRAATTAAVTSSEGVMGPAAAPLVSVARPSFAQEFDARLRDRERELAALPGSRIAPLTAPAVAAAPPLVGDVKSFKVCSNLGCTSFANVSATARFVGAHAAIYVDNDVPPNDPLQPADFAELGTAFDTYHYPIDTTAFGRESDLDNNQVVIILMTDAVNALTTDCANGRVVGFFYGGDLLTGPNSNRAEVFYTIVPAPPTPNCSVVTRRLAVDNLKPTLIHEFQHMISFNQHVLVRSGSSEETWLNEGFSHFAEELGGRLIPNAECTPAFTSCRSQYTSGNILNSYDYFKNPESFFLVGPSSSNGTLQERGASWHFLRWVLDQYASDSILATATSRAMVATNQTGVANVQAATGASFATMVPQWLMASYLDDGNDLPEEATGRLRLKSWGLRAIWTNPANQKVNNGPFEGFPLLPETISGVFSRSGVLRGGSGRHFRVTQPSNGPVLNIHVVKNSSGDPLDAAVVARYGIVRIR
ncbi:MAG: hypothetical protein HOP28_17805 [Gemmatimonadales bacterium]|nr:hypothetical protein [Gemmatimonadales bacterium]